VYFFILSRIFRRDSGMGTTEYALCTVAAAAFAVILYTILTGSDIVEKVTALISDSLEEP
jgi:hypothetical protein